jgi:hypothetical protein
MRIGIIARSDNTGLGYQTKELTDMLKPDKVMLIDFSPHNNNVQHPEWYDGYNVTNVLGYPTGKEIEKFLNNLDVVLSCETFYNNEEFIEIAKVKNVKTFLQYNYELFGNLVKKKMPLPDVLISPSSWELQSVIDKFGRKAKVVHIPPPTTPGIFSNALKENISKTHNRILHIGGKRAAMDRNGTDTVVEMLRYSKANYELVIRTQTRLEISSNDSRLTIDYNDQKNREDMYSGFDFMVLPRRYAGLCLPMNEALLSGLPVFMTNISPNNKVLPSDWLVDASVVDQFKAKTLIDVYGANPRQLAEMIDEYVMLKDKAEQKRIALEIGTNNFAPEKLKNKYYELFNSSHI